MAVRPNMNTTLSVVSPDKAAQIRSAVTGALRKDQSGLLHFEQTVETTFLLPWDLNPQVQPEKLSVSVRDQIRLDLLDPDMLTHLEGCGSINWHTLPTWQCQVVPAQGGRGGEGGDKGEAGGVAEGAEQEWKGVGQLAQLLEDGYNSAHQMSFVADLVTYEVDFLQRRLLNSASQTLFNIRRLAFCPLMPMKTEGGPASLFHACSLAFWGVHDRTSLLREAVDYCLGDPKAQFLLYNRWSQQGGGKQEFPQWEAAKKNITNSPGLHIFALANVVQRPIIVYAHSDSPVGGVYLPLLWKDSQGQVACHAHPHLRNPIALGYNFNTNHFTPLVTFKGPRGPLPLLLPLTSSTGKQLPIHFLSQTERAGDATAILSELMYVDLIPPKTTPPSSPAPQTLAAISNAGELPEVMDTLVKRYQSLFL